MTLSRMPKLSEARKQMSKEEQQAPKEPEMNRERSKSMDTIGKMPKMCDLQQDNKMGLLHFAAAPFYVGLSQTGI